MKALGSHNFCICSTPTAGFPQFLVRLTIIINTQNCHNSGENRKPLHQFMFCYFCVQNVQVLENCAFTLFRSAADVLSRFASKIDSRSESPMKPDSDAVEPSEDAKCIPSPASSNCGEILSLKKILRGVRHCTLHIIQAWELSSDPLISDVF